MDGIKNLSSGLMKSLKGEHTNSTSVAHALGYEAGEKIRKMGDMGGRAVSQLRDGAGSVLNALKQALQAKPQSAATPEAKQQRADEMTRMLRDDIGLL
jgi:hypothetical protein